MSRSILGLLIYFSAQTAFSESCATLIERSKALQLLQFEDVGDDPTRILGFYVERTQPCTQGTCFFAHIYDIESHSVLDPVEGFFKDETLFFNQILDQEHHTRINRYHGICRRNGADGEFLDQSDRVLGRFFLTK